MFTCEHCQPLLLPYLYDALERDERARLKEHLESCSECRAALEKAESQRGLLAEAGKSEFAEVRFAPPADTAKRLAEPTVVLQQRPRRLTTWRRWAMAAAILLAVVGAGGYVTFAGWHGHQEQLLLAKNNVGNAEEEARKKQQELEQQRKKSQNEIRAIQEQINKLVGDWNKEEADTRQKVMRAAPNGVKIQGPKSLQAGGRNEFFSQLPKPAGFAPLTESKADVVARVVDERSKDKKVLVEQKIGDKGAFNFDLPRDLPVAPGAQLVLEIESKGNAPFQVREHLALIAPEY